jgi:hypothetical protein
MMLRQIEAERKFCQHIDLAALQQIVSTQTIRAVLQQCGKQAQRERKLCQEAVVWLLIASTLLSHLSLGLVLEKITHGLRLLWPSPEAVLPSESALTYRRYQLGVKPLQLLFRQVCRPLATPETPGAFLFGLRLLALDGHQTYVPDTPENVAHFGRHSGSRGEAASPQVQGVYLSECGTHATMDVAFAPIDTGEQRLAARLLRSVGPGDLLMWDRGLHSFDLLARTCARGAHVLGRLSAQIKPTLHKRLPDGTWLVWLTPSDDKRRKSGERCLVRLICYTFDDPARPGSGETHRLVTTLLDWQRYPACELACAYHVRWEIEIAFDEIETHQQPAVPILRSRKPVGVLQEMYALLIAHYAVRALMHQAAHEAQVAPTRLSFVRALRLVEQALVDFALFDAQSHPKLRAQLLADLLARRLPQRRNRINPRVVKRKMSNFDLKRPEHRQRQQPSKPFEMAVLLI